MARRSRVIPIGAIAVSVVFGAAGAAPAQVGRAERAKAAPFSSAPPDSDIWIRGNSSVARFDHATGAFEGLVEVDGIDYVEDVHVDPQALWVVGRRDAHDGSSTFGLARFAGSTGKRTTQKLTAPDGSAKLSVGTSPNVVASTKSAVIAEWSTGSDFALIDLLDGTQYEDGLTAYQDGPRAVIERRTADEPFIEWAVVDESGTVGPSSSASAAQAAADAAIPERAPGLSSEKLVRDGVLYSIASAQVGRAYARALVRAPLSGGPATALRLPDSTKAELEQLAAGTDRLLLSEGQDGRLRVLDPATLDEQAVVDKVCSLAADLPCGVSTAGQSTTPAVSISGTSSRIPRSPEVWVLRGDGGLIQLDPATLRPRLTVSKAFRDAALAGKLRPGAEPR